MTYIPYDPNVPQFISDSLEETQPDLLNNFLTLFNIFAKDHIPLDDLTVPGNHTKIELVQQNSAIQTGVSELNTYNKNDEKSTNQVFLRNQGNAIEIQYTCYQIYGLTQTDDLKRFFTFLPGQIIMYFGTFRNLKNDILELYPPVAKKIITVSCGLIELGTFATRFKARVELIQSVDTYFTKVRFYRSFGLNVKSDPQSYIILANM